MEPLDSIAPQFRIAQERWPTAPTLANHYRAVCESYEGSGHSLIVTIKSFIECVCLTILGEFGTVTQAQHPSTTDFLTAALATLGLRNTRGASKLDKVLSAHNRLADALSEVRNESDPVAHGKDGFLDALTTNERRAFLLIADTILALLLSAHNGREPDLQHTREPWDRFAHLNERVDRTVTMESEVEEDDKGPVLVLTVRNGALPDGVRLRVEPSRLLYEIDRTAYVEFLTSAGVGPKADATAAEERTEEPVAELRRGPTPEPALAEVVPAYAGRLAFLQGALNEYIASLNLPIATGQVGANVGDSVLAAADPHMGLDWTAREPLLAGMRVALRRTLERFGVNRERADFGARHLVSWLKIQAAGLPDTQLG